jgi:hypothetical protein
LCYVCGETNRGDHWPWEARELDPWEPFNETAFLKHKKGIWLLKTSIIGNYCISHPEGQFSTLVGDLTCLGLPFWVLLSLWDAMSHVLPLSHITWSHETQPLLKLLQKSLTSCIHEIVSLTGRFQIETEMERRLLPTCATPWRTDVCH